MKPASSRFFVPRSKSLGPPRYLSRIAPAELFVDSAIGHAPTTIAKPAELEWWDWTVLLLQAAAEVEHALLVQYLYAAYSLSPGPYPGGPANSAGLVAGWRRALLKLAREEMAHLLTVQNLLHVVGSSPSLDRDPFPSSSPLYPFPFGLEPLSNGSLAKYIVAEMPASAEASIPDVIAEATAAAGHAVHRVGPLYMTLAEILQDPARIVDGDLDFASATTVQADPRDWFANTGGLLGALVDTRATAVRILREIGEQGEGPWSASAGTSPSHYDRLLEIYRAFPKGVPSTWAATSPVPFNPTTAPDGSPGAILDPVSLLWAQFGNVRYRILLTSIAHALGTAGPTESAGVRTTKGVLIDWAFEEMVGRNAKGLGAIAERLASRPLTSASAAALVAALPFEMPFTTSLPPQDHARWRLHRSLLNVAIRLADQLQAAGEDDALLQEYRAIDAGRRAFLEPRGQ